MGFIVVDQCNEIPMRVFKIISSIIIMIPHIIFVLIFPVACKCVGIWWIDMIIRVVLWDL